MQTTQLLPLSLLAINLYLSWQLSKTETDPDWAMFNLAGFTGSWYGRDFVDCKTPGIHIWYWILAKIVGKNEQRVKFANHFLIGIIGLILFMATGNFHAAMIYTIMINSAWLWVFHGNVTQLPAALIFLSFATPNPWIAGFLWTTALAIEPKLLPTWAVWTWTNRLIIPATAAIGFYLMAIILVAMIKGREIFDWIIEGSVIIPWRMSKTRNGQYKWMPWWTGNLMVYILPWTVAAVVSRPELNYWLPIALYIIFISLGKVIRPNHLIPLVPFIAMAGIPEHAMIILLFTEILGAGFYLGNIWARHYTTWVDYIRDACATGDWLKEKPGTLWVNGMHTEIYIHARKPVQFGLAEQIEINSVAKERRKVMEDQWQKKPPDWVVMTEHAIVEFVPNGYDLVAQGAYNKVYKKRSLKK
jgi:hypothetical protein